MAEAGDGGRVLLVGAGPGDPDLITVRGAAALRRADVVIHDTLSSRELLDLAPAAAERIDVGKRGHDAPTRSQGEINALLVARARAGHLVVRLKGGDPFLYGRGGEEASACRAAGVPFAVVPGVSAALAAPAAAGIPVTDRRYSASLAIVTGHRDRTRPWTSIRWGPIAAGADTVVALMGMRNLEAIVTELLAAGRDPATPAAIVMEGATPRQRVVEAPLAALPQAAREASLAAPAAIVVGDVVRLRRELAWYDRGPLFGRRVLVTRPTAEDDELVGALREAGAAPLCVPLLEIAPAADPEPLRRALRRLSGYDALLMTSRNAVHFFGRALGERGLAPEKIAAPCFCVGPATARAARALGLDPVAAPERHGGAATLGDFVAERISPAGRRFLFLCGAQARAALPTRLVAAGARVDSVIVYSTKMRAAAAATLRETLAAGGVDAVTLLSPSAARAFAEALAERGGSERGKGSDPSARLEGKGPPVLRGTAVAAIGATTAAAVRRAGIDVDVVPERPGSQTLVAALARHFARDKGAGATAGDPAVPREESHDASLQSR